MEKLIAHKWKIAALTLITLPLSIYMIASPSSEINGKLVIFIGIFPLLFAVIVELLGSTVSEWRHYKETGEFPPSEIEGSPVGNKIAIVLAILFGLIFVMPIIWVMVKNFL